MKQFLILKVIDEGINFIKAEKVLEVKLRYKESDLKIRDIAKAHNINLKDSSLLVIRECITKARKLAYNSNSYILSKSNLEQDLDYNLYIKGV